MVTNRNGKSAPGHAAGVEALERRLLDLVAAEEDADRRRSRARCRARSRRGSRAAAAAPTPAPPTPRSSRRGSAAPRCVWSKSSEVRQLACRATTSGEGRGHEDHASPATAAASRKRCTSPITTASTRYITLAAATAPPGLKVRVPCCSSSVPATKLAGGDVGERDDHVDQRDPDEGHHRARRRAAPSVLARDLGDRAARRGAPRRRGSRSRAPRRSGRRRARSTAGTAASRRSGTRGSAPRSGPPPRSPRSAARTGRTAGVGTKSTWSLILTAGVVALRRRAGTACATQPP